MTNPKHETTVLNQWSGPARTATLFEKGGRLVLTIVPKGGPKTVETFEFSVNDLEKVRSGISKCFENISIKPDELVKDIQKFVASLTAN